MSTPQSLEGELVGSLPAGELVPGDLISLRVGDKVSFRIACRSVVAFGESCGFCVEGGLDGGFDALALFSGGALDRGYDRPLVRDHDDFDSYNAQLGFPFFVIHQYIYICNYQPFRGIRRVKLCHFLSLVVVRCNYEDLTGPRL